MVTFNKDVDYNVSTLQSAILGHFGSYDPDNQLAVAKIFTTIQGEMPFAGFPAVFLRLAGCNRGAKNDACYFCFPENKIIATADRGKIKMRELEVGTKLFTFNKNKELVETTVSKVHSRDVFQDDLMQLRIKRNGKIERHLVVCTREHPFNVKNKGWIKAEDLKKGMKIIHASRSEILSYLRKINNPMFNSDSRRRMMLNKIYAKSRLEERAHEALKSIVPTVKYVGDNNLAIGDEKHGFYCPDFIVRGTKKLIEVYDPTFPNYAEPRKTLKQRDAYESSRREHFAKFGYEVEFLTNSDLDFYNHPGSGNDKEFAPEKYFDFALKMREFVTNGIEIVEAIPITNHTYAMNVKKSPGRKKNSVAVTNITCHPHNHFILDGMHVHNCDTYFSIDDETKLYDATKLASELEEMVKEYGSQGIMLVITGGEPMLQAPALAKFIEIMDDADVFNFIQLETNGDLFKTKPATALLEKISELNDEYFEDGEDYPDLMPISVVISPKRTVKHIEKCAFSKYASEPGFFVRILVSADEHSQYYIIPEFMIEEWEMIHFFISPITEYKRKPDDHEIVNIAEDIDIAATRLNISRAIHLANMFGCRVSLQAHSYIGIP